MTRKCSRRPDEGGVRDINGDVRLAGNMNRSAQRPALPRWVMYEYDALAVHAFWMLDHPRMRRDPLENKENDKKMLDRKTVG